MVSTDMSKYDRVLPLIAAVRCSDVECNVKRWPVYRRYFRSSSLVLWPFWLLLVIHVEMVGAVGEFKGMNDNQTCLKLKSEMVITEYWTMNVNM